MIDQRLYLVILSAAAAVAAVVDAATCAATGAVTGTATTGTGALLGSAAPFLVNLCLT